MNIRWVKSRSKNNNITQAYLRWYEGGKQKTRVLNKCYKYIGRNLDSSKIAWNKRVEIDTQEILLTQKKELSQGIFNIDKWDKRGKSFVEYARKYISNKGFDYNNKTIYSQAVNLFEKYFGIHKQFHNLTKEDVDNFKAELRDNSTSRFNKPYELNSINTYINRLKLIYQSAQEDMDILTSRENYFKNAYVKVPKDIKSEYINSAEYAQLDYNKCQNIDIAKAFMFSIQTGLRKSDILALTWGDLKKDEKGLHIYLIMQKTTTKLRVAITDMCRDLLGDRKGDHMKLLPFSYSVSNIGYLNVWLAQTFPNKAIGQQSGRNGVQGLTFHSARASFITNMLMSGIAPTRVQTYVGHRDLKTTLSYYRGSTEMQDEDFKKMNDIYQYNINLHKANQLIR